MNPHPDPDTREEAEFLAAEFWALFHQAHASKAYRMAYDAEEAHWEMVEFIARKQFPNWHTKNRLDCRNPVKT